MDVILYNKVRDVDARIRSFTAGEAITKGQLVTVDNAGNAVVNKKRIGTVTASSVAAVTIVATFPLDATHILAVDALSAVHLVTISSDGSIAFGTCCYCGTTGISVQISSVKISKITATTFLLTGVTYGSYYQWLQVASFSGTNITLGTCVLVDSGYANITACMVSPTDGYVLYGMAANGSSNLKYFSVSGTTITLATAIVTISLITFLDIVALDSTTAVAVSTNNSVVYKITGVQTPVANVCSICYDTNVATIPTYKSIATVDATHVILVTSLGICVAKIAGQYVYLSPFKTAHCNTVSIPSVSNVGKLSTIDATHYVIYLPTGEACILTLSMGADGEYAITFGKINTSHQVSNTDISFSNCFYSALSNSSILASFGYASYYAFQQQYPIGDSIIGLSNIVGIAMDDSILGGTVSVLESGSSKEIYTGLTPGTKYANYNGTLASMSISSHVFNPGNVVTNLAFPITELDNTEIAPYAVAVTSNEVLILDPFSARGNL